MAELRVEHVMGLPVRVHVRDAVVDLDAIDAAFAWLRWVDARFSPYRADSDVCRLDHGASGGIHPLVHEVLARCAALRTRTGGAFDVHAGGSLDPSGYVKGWAAERAAAILAAAGAADFCVDAGGDLALRGGPWRVGVAHPSERRRVAAVLCVGDGAVATSGTSERGDHVLDPRTGRPARGLLSVTVTGPDLGTADAYATAAFALGPDGPAWTATLPDGYEAMSILPSGRVLSTPGFARSRGQAPTWPGAYELRRPGR